MTQQNNIPSSTTPPPGVSFHYELPAKKPIITYILLTSTILIYFLQFLSKQFFQIDVLAIYGMKINELINEGQIWRLITSMFLHANTMHIGFNMYALYSFGRSLERFYGHSRFLFLYLLSGFAGNIVSYYFTDNPSLGASTAIFGLVAAEGVFIHINKKFFPNAQKALQQLIMIVIINFILGLSPQIDNWGHLGGFVGGLAFAWFTGPLLDAKITETGIKLFDKHIGKISTITIIVEFLILAVLTAIRVIFN